MFLVGFGESKSWNGGIVSVRMYLRISCSESLIVTRVFLFVLARFKVKYCNM
jgi:hypothetical protein